MDGWMRCEMLSRRPCAGCTAHTACTPPGLLLRAIAPKPRPRTPAIGAPGAPVQPELGRRLGGRGARRRGHKEAVSNSRVGLRRRAERRGGVGGGGAAGGEIRLQACWLQVDWVVQVVAQHHGQHLAHRRAQHGAKQAGVLLVIALGLERLQARRVCTCGGNGCVSARGLA